MTIAINPSEMMTGGDYPPADSYSDHELAMEHSYTMNFEGGPPTNTGVYPTVKHMGVPGSDSHHVHALVYADIVWRVSVTFMNGSDHVGNAFYFPTPGRSSTYSRYCTRIPKYDATARGIADDVFKAFFKACGKKPGKAANEAIVAAVNKAIVVKEELAKKDEEERKNAHKKVIPVAASKKDQGLFGQTTASEKKMTDEEALARIEAYRAKGGTFMAGDEKMIKVALQDGKPKDQWNMLIRKYYDAIAATGPTATATPVATAVAKPTVPVKKT